MSGYLCQVAKAGYGTSLYDFVESNGRETMRLKQDEVAMLTESNTDTLGA
jgi:hypothetical protein